MRFLLALCPLALSAAVTVTSVQTTPTQAVIRYVAPSTSACTVEVSEAAGYSPVVNDVNTSLFAGSNMDSRTGNVTAVTHRTFIIGQRTSGTASDGLLYSRALQAATLHYYRVTCGAETATGTFTTVTPPIGKTYPEPPPYNSDGDGGYAWPTVDWTDATKTYVDPMTGVLLKMAYPLPAHSGHNLWNADNHAFPLAIDTNSAWTDIANILSTSVEGPFATYAGAASDPVFLPIPLGDTHVYPWSSRKLDDVRLTLYGSGDDASAANRTMEACLTLASGSGGFAGCLSDVVEIVLPQTTAAAVTAPSSYPTFGLAGWHGGTATLLASDVASAPVGTVNTNGTTVTRASGNYFTLGWAAGTKIKIADSAPTCTANLCTVASVESATSLTISETLGELSGKAYNAYAFGILLRKKSGAGSVSVASVYSTAWDYGPEMPLNGVADFCSKNTVTVSYAADGTTPITPVQGRLCAMQSNAGDADGLVVLLIESTGEVRTLSDLYHSLGPPSWSAGNATLPYASFHPTDGLSLIVVKADPALTPKRAIWKVTYDAATGKFKQWAGEGFGYGARPADNMTWTRLTETAGTVEDQIAAAITTNPFYASSMGATASYAGIVGNHALFSLSFGGGQDRPCFLIRFNAETGVLSQIVDTMGGSSSTGRYGTCHSVQTLGTGDWVAVSVNQPYVGDVNSYLGGPFVVRDVSHVYKSGAWNTNTSIGASDFYTCEADGTLGDNCLKIRATGEPCTNYTPSSAAEKSKHPCPWDATKSMAQTLAVGDYLWVYDPDHGMDGKSEKMRVLSKTDIGDGAFELEVYRMATCRGVTDYDSASHRTHADNWQAWMGGTGLCAGNAWWISSSSPTWYIEDSVLSGGHFSFGSGESSSRYSLLGTGYAVRYSQTMPDQIGGTTQYTALVDSAVFNGSTQAPTLPLQSYPNKGQWSAPASEQKWLLDLRHYNPSSGVGGESPSMVDSLTYALQDGTSHTYKVTGSGVTASKTFPVVAFAGRYLLRDKSGPGSTIADADGFAVCVAYADDECRTGSSTNDVYVSVPQAQVDLGGCVVNTYQMNAPCVTQGVWVGGNVIQTDVSRNDPRGSYGRPLSMVFTGPGRQYHFQNAHSTPEGKWAFANPGWIGSIRNDLMLMKLSPWTSNSVNRGIFVKVPITIGPGSDKARIRFGYDTNFYCTSRAEACVTDASLSPFAFVTSDSLTPTTCDTGCTINVPAIAGRILYYRIERLNTGGTLLSTGTTQVVSVN